MQYAQTVHTLQCMLTCVDPRKAHCGIFGTQVHEHSGLIKSNLSNCPKEYIHGYEKVSTVSIITTSGSAVYL